MKLSAYTYKKIARNALSGHWAGAVAVGLCAVVLGAFLFSFLSFFQFGLAIFLAMSFLEFIPDFSVILLMVVLVLAIFYFFVGGAVRLGYIDYNLALLDRRQAGFSNLGNHFSSWYDMIIVKILMFLIISLWSLLFIIPGIMAYYSYAMVPYILEEKPDYNVYEAFQASRYIMKKHRWQLFCLHLSFIGWFLLGFLTLGIGFLFATPYKNAAEAAFYNEISGRADAYYGRKERNA